jgi:hypothetical protein
MGLWARAHSGCGRGARVTLWAIHTNLPNYGICCHGNRRRVKNWGLGFAFLDDLDAIGSSI